MAKWEDGFSDCEICGGSGWLRKEVEVFDDGFGDLEMCQCLIELLESLGIEIQEDKELKEPDPEQFDLGWQKWTD